MDTLPVYLEVGAKRALAGALDWPGWCVAGRDPQAALAALFAAGPRYAALLTGTRLGFTAPKRPEAFDVVETIKGNATTDFGVPGLAPQADAAPATPADLRRFEKLLAAGWAGLQTAAQAAHGRELTKGPRGGGRSLDAILEHVIGAQASYLTSFGWKLPGPLPPLTDLPAAIATLQAAAHDGLAAAAQGQIAPTGPRGGKRWSPRYFVRRSLWHIVDHVWEIENRLPPAP
ncbi:MAG: hypothetical protein IT317_17810 [Anaerolineales bacterium]|nr:hypothetical protein [Anaerolineales bacterium]